MDSPTETRLKDLREYAEAARREEMRVVIDPAELLWLLDRVPVPV